MSFAVRGSSARVAAFKPAIRTSRVCARPFTSSAVAPQPRSVKVGFFNFGKNQSADPNAYKTSNKREEYIFEDVDDYFNYMVSSIRSVGQHNGEARQRRICASTHTMRRDALRGVRRS